MHICRNTSHLTLQFGLSKENRREREGNCNVVTESCLLPNELKQFFLFISKATTESKLI